MREKGKAYLVYLVIIAFFTAAGCSVYGASHRAEYVAAAMSQSVYRLDVASSRGVIYDRNLKPLVGEKKKAVAAVAPAIETVGAVEKATGGKCRERLGAALADGKPFVLDLPDGTDVSLLSETAGVDVFFVPERYSEDQLAPHIIGYVDGLGVGVSGVELAMNDVLEEHSAEAAVYYQVDALGRAVAGGEHRVDGTPDCSVGGVSLTVDNDIQLIAEKAAQPLGKGAVVVTEVPNCEVRACVSLPSFSPLDLGEASKREDGALVNRAFCAYAPGSVFKLVTSCAALEKGWDSRDEFDCTGSVNAGGMVFNCINGTAHGRVNMRTAIEKSCNCYFINLGRSLGGAEILSAAYNMGLGEEQEFGRGLFTDGGTLPASKSLNNTRSLANFSFGQGETTVSPLQMCAVINAIADGGVYYSPKLIEGVVNGDCQKVAVKSSQDKKVRVMESSTAEAVMSFMESAARHGTGKKGAPTNGVSGIKTGTAQTGIYENGQELLHFWYCGYVCVDGAPRYCVSVLCESTPDDNGAAAKVFKEVGEGLIEYEKGK